MFKTLRKNLAEDFNSAWWVFLKLVGQEFIYVLLIPFRLVLFPLTYFASLFKSQRKTLGKQFVSIFCLEYSKDDLARLEDDGPVSRGTTKVGTNFVIFILWIIFAIVAVPMGMSSLLLLLFFPYLVIHFVKFAYTAKIS